MSIDNLAKKAKDLKAKGMTAREICQEMHLSNPTVKWLLAKKPEGGMPADVKTGWRSIGVSGARISSIAEIMTDIIVEEAENGEFGIDMVAGIVLNGMTLGVFVSEMLDIDFGVVKPTFDESQTTLASNYAGFEGKDVVIVDDLVSTGGTCSEVIDYIRKEGGNPVLAVVIINKLAENEINGVPLRALVRARPMGS